MSERRVLENLLQNLKALESLKNLPDEAVLLDDQVCLLGNFSHDTLRRLEKAGDAPPRTQLSKRRHGRTVGAYRRWIAARTARSDAA